jgi:ssDNA-binding Zn-finger/Zn-ribbon topoisomerase 1
MNNPKCPYCGGEMVLWDSGFDKVWYVCPKCHAESPTAHTEEEARAVAVPQEMSVREYVRERDRMCAHHNAFCDDCPVLPERMEGEKVLHNCPIWTMRDPEKAVAIVEKWAREHPEEVGK